MSLTVILSAMIGLCVGAGSCYLWRERLIRQQLRQILAVMETDRESEAISLPPISKLRRQANISRQQQQQLEQQLSSWQSVLQAAPIGYLLIDAENQILWCNQVACELLNIQTWESGQVRLLLELVRSYELDRAIQKSRSTQLPRELIWQFYFGYQAIDRAESIWLKANSIPLADGAVGVFIESQQPQVEAAAARERWLTDLAHEIRTPLTAMRLLAETLQSKVPPNLTRWVDRLLHETNRLIDLVQNFLELSQLEASPDRYLQLATVDIGSVIDEAWRTVEPLASQRQITLVSDRQQQLSLTVDRARFIQVLINLFDNSIKHCATGGRIWLEIRTVQQSGLSDAITIDLYDDGAGFDRDDLTHVFERLYRGDRSRNRQNSASNPVTVSTGSGLGLAIVRQIIRAHHGTIVAKNHPDTGGAWIHISLPYLT